VSRRAGAAAFAVAAAIWIALAWLLWQTSKVPRSLRLPHLDEHDYFTRAAIARAASYERVSDLIWIAGVVIELAVLVVYSRYGARFARESAAGPIGTGMLLGMLGFALVWLAELPVQVADLWWARRHGLSFESYGATIFGGWVALAGEFAFLCFALLVVMGFARRIGEWWWLAAVPVFALLALLFAFVSPYLGKTHPLKNPELVKAARVLERREHLSHIPIVVQDIHSSTSLPNSEAEGIGPSRRVVLFDTMLDGRFSTREVTFVLGHELGHVARNHVLKLVGWFTLFAFPGAWLVALITRRRGGMGQPEAVPLALLAVVVLGLLALPLQNAISRHIESEADWLALQTTRDPKAGLALFRAFVPTTLSEPNPPTWDYLLLENHPTIMQRLAMVVACQRRQATSAAQLP
jgi:STE24 endopeptidase